MPWLFSETEKFVAQQSSYKAYPNTLIAGYIDEASQKHIATVKAHEQKLADRKKAAEDAAAAKQAEKLRKRAEKERLRKEAERK